ncbi:MAG: calcium/sodium antiporter [Lachnospiraceae bacterium]|nr:calcium/sodium antiporter [Lachnospiraceae bacterium]
MLKAIIFLIIGFLLLVKGADYFVDGAASIATKLRIPSFVIGLTIVAFGTSAPELAVSLSAALKGSNDIAIGNVVGSNIFNTLVVLGASAAITPIAVEKGIIKKDFPLCILVSVLLGLLSLDMFLFQSSSMTIGRIDGITLLLAFIYFMYTTVKSGMKQRSETEETEETEDKQSPSLWKSIFICLVGLAGIIIGGDLSVDGAKEIARAFGLSEAFIGLTIVAFGTSLPELVTSIIAAKKGENDIAVGNVIGSNIFNILLILGLSATILPMNVSNTYLYDIGILIIISLVTFIPIAKTKKVSRSMGITMVISYILYTAYLILR